MVIELEALKEKARHFETALETSDREKTTLQVSALFDNHFTSFVLLRSSKANGQRSPMRFALK